MKIHNPNITGSLVLSGSAGTSVNFTSADKGVSGSFSGSFEGSLKNVKTIDTTTESTIESSIDTLANLTSIQGNTVTLGGNLVTQNNNVTINAAGAARTLTLNESLTVGDGHDGTLTYSAASKTLTVEDTTNLNQDLTSDASPTFAAGTITGDLSVGGTLTAQEVHTEFESASILFTSGSTRFGDDTTDKHRVTGSMDISGSLDIPHGNLIVTDNIGIGTSTVVSELHLAKTSGEFGIKLTNNATGHTSSDGAHFNLDANNDLNLGTKDSTNIVFETADSERVRIKSDGDVGIGTNNPSHKLDILENAETNVVRFFNDGGDQNRDVMILQGGADAGPGNTRFITFNDGNGDAFGFIQGPANAATAGISFNTTADTSLLTLSGSRVGIGTVNPLVQLDIQNTDHAILRLLAGTNKSASMRLRNDAQDWDVNCQTTDNFAIFDQTNSSTALSIAHTSYHATFGGNITVDYNDATSINAGEIAGDNDVLGINIKNQNTSNGSGGMLKFIGGNGDNLTAIGHIQDASNSASMLFFTETGGSFAERMRVDHTGALSVGTNSPATSAKLHIKGNGGGQAIAVFEDDTVNANVLIKASDANRNSILNFGDAASTEIGQIDYDHNDNSMRFVVNAAETIRIANTGDVGIGDDNPDGRLTVNHGANDTGHITVKNSDVAHSFTSLFANDTFCDMRKYSNAEGGMNIQGISEGERGLALSNFSTVYDTPSNGTAVDKGFQFFAYALSGTNAGNLNSNGTAFIFRVRRGGSSPAVLLIDEDGDIHSDGSTSITGYDYAEMFEWEDGNTNGEDRVGYSVVFGSSGDKIRVASGSEEPIGVVSARPGVIGDNPLAWQGKWKTDEWDRKIPKLIPMVSWSYDFTRGNGEVVQKTFRTEIAYTGSFLSNIPSGSSERGVPYGGSIPSNAHYYNKEESQFSDDYDETKDYTTRRGRKEWDTIGLMGKLKIRTGQATGSRWIKMKDVSDSIQLWLVK